MALTPAKRKEYLRLVPQAQLALFIGASDDDLEEFARLAEKKKQCLTAAEQHGAEATRHGAEAGQYALAADSAEMAAMDATLRAADILINSGVDQSPLLTGKGHTSRLQARRATSGSCCVML